MQQTGIGRLGGLANAACLGASHEKPSQLLGVDLQETFIQETVHRHAVGIRLGSCMHPECCLAQEVGSSWAKYAKRPYTAS